MYTDLYANDYILPSQPSTLKCNPACVCEQKYMAYDPNNDSSAIFMDWFIFPY